MTDNEEYQIGLVHGFMVSNKDYRSEVFDTIEKAKAHKEKLEKTPLKEITVTKSVKK
jgi:hypothetical protein